jgi:hypothetical protein
VVERRGPHLLESGRPFVVNGFNTYWLMYFAADPATRPTVTAALAEAADAGLNVCRTWAFNDGGYRALQLKPFSYDEDVFQVSLGCFCWVGTAQCLFDEMRGRVPRLIRSNCMLGRVLSFGNLLVCMRCILYFIELMVPVQLVSTAWAFSIMLSISLNQRLMFMH